VPAVYPIRVEGLKSVPRFDDSLDKEETTMPTTDEARWLPVIAPVIAMMFLLGCRGSPRWTATQVGSNVFVLVSSNGERPYYCSGIECRSVVFPGQASAP
jgi:hypothetical protein